MLPASDEAGVPQQGGIFRDQFRSHVGPSGFPANKVTEVRTIIDPMNSDRHSYADKDKRIMAVSRVSSAAVVWHRATRSAGWRQPVDASAPRAPIILPTTVASTPAACSQPINSRHSSAVL